MVMVNKYGIGAAPVTPQMFASAGIEHMEKYGMNTVYTTKVKEARYAHAVHLYTDIINISICLQYFVIYTCTCSSVLMAFQPL